MYCSNADLNKFCLHLVILISLPKHLLHSNKCGIFVQRICQLHSYAGKCSGKYLNLVFFFPILSSYFIESFILMLLHLFIYYQIMLIIFCIYAFYFHLRGLQICSLAALVNIWCQKQWSMVCKYWFILWSSLWIFQYQIEQRLL